MKKIEIPEKLRDERDGRLIRGPFVVEMAGVRFPASDLVDEGDVFAYWDGSRTHDFDDTYKAQIDGDQLFFVSYKRRHAFTIRPLLDQDSDWIDFTDAKAGKSFAEDLYYVLKNGAP